MEDKKIDSYTIFPRSIVSDYRNGKLTIPERNLLSWLRQNGNPYGIAFADLDLLSRETFNEPVSKSYINKLILSLKSKRYIWYAERKGRRGSFEVHIDFWIMKDGSIRRLTKYFEQEVVRSRESTQALSQSEERPQNEPQSQRIQMLKESIKATASRKYKGDSVRGSDNDTDTDKEKENISLQLRSEKFDIGSYKPRTAEEQRCLEIANEVGEESVGFTIGIYRDHGIEPLEDALTEYQETDLSKFDNPKAFFNSLVMKRISIDLGK